MRTFGSAIFAVIALVLAALALPGAWIDRNVVSEDGFVELAGPLGSERSFQEELTAALATEVTVGANLPEGIAALVEPIVANAATEVAGLPGYPAAWEETLRRSHALSFADSAGLPRGSVPPSSLALDLAPLVGLVTQQVSDGIGAEVPAPDETLVDFGGSGDRVALERLEAAAALWTGAAVAAAVGALISLGLARRRSTTVALLGLGIAILGVVYWVTAQAAAGLIGQASGANTIAGIFRDGLIARGVESIEPLSFAVIGVGVLVLVAGTAARILAGASRRR